MPPASGGWGYMYCGGGETECDGGGVGMAGLTNWCGCWCWCWGTIPVEAMDCEGGEWISDSALGVGIGPAPGPGSLLRLLRCSHKMSAIPRRSKTTPPTTLPAMTPVETEPPPPLLPLLLLAVPVPVLPEAPPGGLFCPVLPVVAVPPLVTVPVVAGVPLVMVDAILVVGKPSRLTSHKPRPLSSTDLTPKYPAGQQKYRFEVRPNSVHAGLAQTGRLVTAVPQSASTRFNHWLAVFSRSKELKRHWLWVTYHSDNSTPQKLSSCRTAPAGNNPGALRLCPVCISRACWSGIGSQCSPKANRRDSYHPVAGWRGALLRVDGIDLGPWCSGCQRREDAQSKFDCGEDRTKRFEVRGPVTWAGREPLLLFDWFTG